MYIGIIQFEFDYKKSNNVANLKQIKIITNTIALVIKDIQISM